MKKNVKILLLFIILLFGINTKALILNEDSYEDLEIRRAYVVGNYIFDLSKHNPTLKDLMLAAQSQTKGDVSIIELKFAENIDGEKTKEYSELLENVKLTEFPLIDAAYIYESEIGIDKEIRIELNSKELSLKPEFVLDEAIELKYDSDDEKFYFYPSSYLEYTEEDLDLNDNYNIYVNYNYYLVHDDEYLLVSNPLALASGEDIKLVSKATIIGMPDTEIIDEEEIFSTDDIFTALMNVITSLAQIDKSKIVTIDSEYSDVLEFKVPEAPLELDVRTGEYNEETGKYNVIITPETCEIDETTGKCNGFNKIDIYVETYEEDLYEIPYDFNEPIVREFDPNDALYIYEYAYSLDGDYPVYAYTYTYFDVNDYPYFLVPENGDEPELIWDDETNDYALKFRLETDRQYDSYSTWSLGYYNGDNELVVENDYYDISETATIHIPYNEGRKIVAVINNFETEYSVNSINVSTKIIPLLLQKLDKVEWDNLRNEYKLQLTGNFEEYFDNVDADDYNWSLYSVENNKIVYLTKSLSLDSNISIYLPINTTKEYKLAVTNINTKETVYSNNTLKVNTEGTPLSFVPAQGIGDESILIWDNEESTYRVVFALKNDYFDYNNLNMNDYNIKLYYKDGNRNVLDENFEIIDELVSTTLPVNTDREYIISITNKNNPSEEIFTINTYYVEGEEPLIMLVRSYSLGNVLPQDGEGTVCWTEEKNAYGLEFFVNYDFFEKDGVIDWENYSMKLYYYDEDNKVLEDYLDGLGGSLTAYIPVNTRRTYTIQIKDKTTGEVYKSANEITIPELPEPFRIKEGTSRGFNDIPRFAYDKENDTYTTEIGVSGLTLDYSNLELLQDYSWELYDIETSTKLGENELGAPVLVTLPKSTTKNVYAVIHNTRTGEQIYSINNICLETPEYPFEISFFGRNGRQDVPEFRWNKETEKYEFDIAGNFDVFAGGDMNEIEKYSFVLTLEDEEFNRHLFKSVNASEGLITVSMPCNTEFSFSAYLDSDDNYQDSLNYLVGITPELPFELTVTESDPGVPSTPFWDPDKEEYGIDLAGVWSEYLSAYDTDDFEWTLYYLDGNNMIKVEDSSEVGGVIAGYIPENSSRTFIASIHKKTDSLDKTYYSNEYTIEVGPRP